MKLIGHFEFGPNHKPFIYPNTKCIQFSNTLSINYWLMAWKNTYSWLTSINLNNNVRICSYEKLCNDATMYEKILDFCQLNIIESKQFGKRKFISANSADPQDYPDLDLDLLDACTNIYNSVNTHSSCI